MEQLRDSFTQEYTRKTVLKPAPTICDRPIPHHNHHIYSYGALHELLTILSNMKPDDSMPEQDEIERYAVRFVVDTDGQLWFAQEGERRETVPAHSEMRSRCYSAGNLFFSKDYQSIVKITNKSGHFKPHMGSLIWVIATLLSVEAPISPTVILDFYPIAEPLNVTFDDLVNLLPEGPLPQSKNNYKIEIEFDESINANKRQRTHSNQRVVGALPKQDVTLHNRSFTLDFFNPAIAGIAINPFQTPPQSPTR